MPPRREGRHATGVCFNSGCPDTGSHAGLTTAPRRPRRANWSFQCIGTKTGSAALLVADARTRNHLAPWAGDADQRTIGETRSRAHRRGGARQRVPMRAPQPRRPAGAGHRVPLVAHAAGVEHQRASSGASPAGANVTDRNRGRPSAVGKRPSANSRAVPAGRRGDRPLHRRQRLVGLVVEVRQRADVEHARCRRSRSRRARRARGRCRPGRDRRRPRPSPCGAPTSATIHQSGCASPGGGRNGALARDAALGIGDGAVLLAPAGGRQHDMGERGRVGLRARNRRRRRTGSAASASRTRSASGRLTAGLVAMIHSALIRPSRDRVEQVDRLEARPGRPCVGALPEAPHRARYAGSSKSMCAASWFASPPTSRPPIALGWPVIENGPVPGLPMRPVARWQLMIALTLSVPRSDWFTPWRTERDGALGRRRTVVEARAGRPASRPQSRGHRGRPAPIARAACQRRVEPGGMPRDASPVERAGAARCASRPLNSATSLPGRERQMQVGARRRSRCGADRSPRAWCRALPRRRRAAGSSTGWHQAVLVPTSTTRSACVEILVAAGHDILAEGADVAGDASRPCTAANWCRYCARADEALHQLVGDVIILGQQLAGDVEGDAVRPVLARSSARKRAGDQVERLVPARASRPPIIGWSSRPSQRRASRRAPCPSSRAGRDWPDAPDRRRSRRRAVGAAQTPQPTPQ